VRLRHVRWPTPVAACGRVNPHDGAVRASRDTRLIVGVLCLLLLMITALAGYPDVNSQLHKRTDAGNSVTLAEGMPTLPGYPPETSLFLRAVQQRIPERAHYVLIGVGTNFCTEGGVHRALIWLAYQLLPRVASCTKEAWWVLYKPKIRLPKGSEIIEQRGQFKLVRVPPTARPPR
jgi:hypothetical protein